MRHQPARALPCYRCDPSDPNKGDGIAGDREGGAARGGSAEAVNPPNRNAAPDAAADLGYSPTTGGRNDSAPLDQKIR